MAGGRRKGSGKMAQCEKFGRETSRLETFRIVVSPPRSRPRFAFDGFAKENPRKSTDRNFFAEYCPTCSVIHACYGGRVKKCV